MRDYTRFYIYGQWVEPAIRGRATAANVSSTLDGIQNVWCTRHHLNCRVNSTVCVDDARS